MNTDQLSPEDLAFLQRFQNPQGNQDTGISMADLAALQAPISGSSPTIYPQDLSAPQPQAVYQQPAIDPRTQQMDQAMLDQVAIPPAATQDPSQTPAAQGQGDPSSSDPNGFIPQPGQSQQGDTVPGPDGQSLTLPPNTGAANLYGGQPAQQQGSADLQSGKQAPAEAGFWPWYRSTYKVEKGTLVPQSHILAMQKVYAENTLRAKGTPPARMINANGHQWVQQGNTLLPADPRPVATQEIHLPDGTLARYVTDSNSPDYLKAQPVYDAATGQPIRSQMPGSQPASQMKIQLDDGTVGTASATTPFRPVRDEAGNIIRGRLPGVQPPAPRAAPTPYSPPIPSMQNAPAAVAGNQGNASMSPEDIKQAYKNGQLSQAAAQSLLMKVHGYRP